MRGHTRRSNVGQHSVPTNHRFSATLRHLSSSGVREMTSDNPYTSPEYTEPAPSGQPRRMGFRHVPAVILFAVSGIWIVVSMLMLASFVTEFLLSSSRLPGPRIAGCSLLVLAGTTWIVAGRYWLRRRWWYAVVLTVVGYLIGAGGASLAFPQLP
jgi:hypothetical protein